MQSSWLLAPGSWLLAPGSWLLAPDSLNSRLLEETICQAAWGMALSASFRLDIEHGVRDYSFWR
jgi:hypothetical protein